VPPSDDIFFDRKSLRRWKINSVIEQRLIVAVHKSSNQDNRCYRYNRKKPGGEGNHHVIALDYAIDAIERLPDTLTQEHRSVVKNIMIPLTLT